MPAPLARVSALRVLLLQLLLSSIGNQKPLILMMKQRSIVDR
jgi:hypothetical protein